MTDPTFELIAAPHTPFDADGQLELEPVPHQAAHLRAAGVTGVLVAGSTGEGPSLTSDERRRLAERWTATGGSLRVMVQVGHCSVAEAKSLAQHAARNGAAAICAAPPSWFAIDTAAALAATCTAIAEGAPELPFFYYHIPALSGVHVPMAPLLDLVRDRIPNFAGVKYTHLDAADFAACRRDHGDAIQLLWGCDEQLVTGLRAGAHGAVGSTYNFAAPLYQQILAAHRSGDAATADRLQARAVLLVDTLAGHGYPAAAKSVMRLLGVDCGPVRLPLTRLAPGGEDAVRVDLERIGFFDWIRG